MNSMWDHFFNLGINLSNGIFLEREIIRTLYITLSWVSPHPCAALQWFQPDVNLVRPKKSTIPQYCQYS